MPTTNVRPHVVPHVARPRYDAEAIRDALLLCGILSSLVYVAANVFAGLSWDGYSFRAQTISELAAIDAPSRSVWIPFGIAYDVLLVAFGFGVWMSAGHSRAMRACAVMLIAIGAIGAVWPPMHMRGYESSLTDTLHIVWAIAISLFTVLAMAFTAKATRTWMRNYSITTIVVVLLFGALTAMEGPAVAANEPTPLIGVFERINLAAYLLWVSVLAVFLMRRNPALH